MSKQRERESSEFDPAVLKSLPEWFRSRLSAHRGYGLPENSLATIRAGIDAGFQMVEFDVQLHDGQLLLGHDDIRDETLSQALAFFHGLDALPKIDIKLTKDQISSNTLAFIYAEIMHHPGKKLVNLSHRSQKVVDGTHPEVFFSAGDYMQAERYLYEFCRDGPLMLNIDLMRYKQAGTVTDTEIIKHIRSLQPIVYTLSPEMTDRYMIDASYSIAKTCGIFNIHGWLHREKGHTITIEQAADFYHRTLAHDLEPFFDIDVRTQVRL